MRVKINDVWYDSYATPICVELSSADKDNISRMAPDATKYAHAPDNHFTSAEEFLKWMEG